MCGIVGYIGKEQAAPILLDGLSKLEYRGYDSAGICIYNQGDLTVAKAKGRLANLVEKTQEGTNTLGNMGIGHTRWATHGMPSDENSHPHMAHQGKIVVVHNGIIENYQNLKEKLESLGKDFQSETDTEVIANLVEHFYDQGFGFRESVRKATERMEGSYALGIMCKDYPDTIIAVKKDSPLIFGYGKDCNYIASDVPAILKYTRDVSYLNDGDMVVFSDRHVHFYDGAGDRINKEPEHVDWELSDAEKGGYAHFMLKEIHEQPKALTDTICPRIRDGKVVLDDVLLNKDYLKNLNRIYMVACGTAAYVGIHGKYILEKLCKIPVEPVVASEFRYAEPVLDEHSLVIIISQSGETADTLAALKEAKQRGARTLAIVNVVGSAIAKQADDVIYTWAGPEIAVASTKAYSTQLSVIYLLALYVAQELNTLDEATHTHLMEELLSLPQKVQALLEPACVETVQFYASKYFNHRDVFFIGRNLDSATCLEASLKLKEIAYIHSEAYAAGELKHGPISMIEQGTLIVALSTNSKLFDKTMSNIREVKARGGEVLGITTATFKDEIEKYVDSAILLPDGDPLFQPSLSIIPLQLFSYYIALLRGCDVDKPRNLAKSVTVE